MPIIILEGIDGSGKSTLAKHLESQSPWPTTVLHRGPIKTSVIEELITPLFTIGRNELLIADRWHLSELIYGPLYRGETQVDWRILLEIERVLDFKGAHKIILEPPMEEITERLAKRGEDFLRPDDAPLVYAAYKGFAKMLNYRVAKTNTRILARRLLAEVAGKAKKSQEAQL